MRLGVWQKTTVFTTTAVVGVSGVLRFVLHDMVDGEPGDVVRLLLILHGVSSYVLLVVLGSLLPLHVRLGWLRRRNIVTGLMVTVTMTILAASGLVLYYGGEDIQVWVRWVHLGFGLGCFMLFPAHAFLTAARSRRSDLPSAVSQDVTSQGELTAGSG